MEKDTKLKQNICDNLNPKKFEITWSEEVQYSVMITAGSEEEAREKFYDNDYVDVQEGDSYVNNDSIEIYEI